MKKQISLRASKRLRMQLEELSTEWVMSRSEVIAVAIDRLWQDKRIAEQNKKRSKMTTCEICGKKFEFGADSDDHESDTGDICGECWRAADAEDNTFDLEDMK